MFVSSHLGYLRQIKRPPPHGGGSKRQLLAFTGGDTPVISHDALLRRPYKLEKINNLKALLIYLEMLFCLPQAFFYQNLIVDFVMELVAY